MADRGDGGRADGRAGGPGARRGRLGLGLRGQLLVALLLVTVGGMASVGVIAVWQTSRAMTAERFERAAALTGTARLLAERVLAPSRRPGDAAGRARLSAAAPEVAGTVGAEEVVFFDERGAPVAPAGAARLSTDERGVAGALSGAPPHARERPREPDDRRGSGARLVAYAPLTAAGRVVGAVRVTFALDAAIDAALARARTSVLVLGALDALVLLLAAAWILRRAVVRPVLALEGAARRVADGDLEARADARGPGELGRLADAFDRMTGSLRQGRESLIRSEKLAGIGRLAAGIAHEVGNPLAAILGYVEMLLGETPERPLEPALRREILERVRSETERIHHILKELLEYSRPPREEAEQVDVARVVEAAVSLARATGRMRAVQVSVRLADDLPPVHATSGRLTQVLLNLLLNAADATGGEGRVVVEGRRDAGRVVLGVADDGPGVPAEVRDKIFDPFFTTKEPGQGTGLGLAVSLAIVEGLGGTLRLCDAGSGAGSGAGAVAEPGADGQGAGAADGPGAPGPRGARFEAVLPVAAGA